MSFCMRNRTSTAKQSQECLTAWSQRKSYDLGVFFIFIVLKSRLSSASIAASCGFVPAHPGPLRPPPRRCRAHVDAGDVEATGTNTLRPGLRVRSNILVAIL